MLSNQKLPYVGRFACDWLRLATTDPHAVHTGILRFDAAKGRGQKDCSSSDIFTKHHYGWRITAADEEDR